MGIFRTTDPTQWDDVDGIIINESAPAPNVRGVAANIGIIVAQAERGPLTLTEVGSIGEIHEIYGKSNFGLNRELKNKKFGRLRVIRALAAGAALAEKTFTDDGGTPADIIKFSAKQGKGAYGNNIQVKIEAGTSSGSKYTIKDTTAGSVMQQEVYDNVTIGTVVSSAVFANSKLVTATVIATSEEPEPVTFTALAGGSDGSIADTDYEAAIAQASAEGAGNFIWLDSYNATRNGYLKTHAAETQDKMPIFSHGEDDSVSTIISAVASLRDVDGRLIMAANWVETVIDGVVTYTSPASWLASILTQTSPHLDPARVESAQFMAGATGLKMKLSRNQYIQLMEAGVCAFENDSDIGIKPKSGVVTQIANSSKVTILRRRMADFLTNSAGKFLKNYQNGVNSKENRTLAGGGIVAFVKGLQRDGILPKDTDVKTGKPYIVDTESLNTDSSIALGFFKILWKQRIYSSNRFMVLSAEIGESVVVTEQE